MGQGGAAVQDTEITHVAHDSLSVQLLAGYGLRLGLKHMSVERDAVLPGQIAARDQELVGASLRCRGGNHKPQSTCAIVQRCKYGAAVINIGGNLDRWTRNQSLNFRGKHVARVSPCIEATLVYDRV